MDGDTSSGDRPSVEATPEGNGFENPYRDPWGVSVHHTSVRCRWDADEGIGGIEVSWARDEEPEFSAIVRGREALAAAAGAIVTRFAPREDLMALRVAPADIAVASGLSRQSDGFRAKVDRAQAQRRRVAAGSFSRDGITITPDAILFALPPKSAFRITPRTAASSREMLSLGFRVRAGEALTLPSSAIPTLLANPLEKPPLQSGRGDLDYGYVEVGRAAQRFSLECQPPPPLFRSDRFVVVDQGAGVIEVTYRNAGGVQKRHLTGEEALRLRQAIATLQSTRAELKIKAHLDEAVYDLLSPG